MVPQISRPTYEGRGPHGHQVLIEQWWIWAQIQVGEDAYESIGSDSPFRLFSYDSQGHRRFATLDDVFRIILQMRKPKRKKDPDGYENALRNNQELQRMVAAWRKAHALAAHFVDWREKNLPTEEMREGLVTAWKIHKEEEKQGHRDDVSDRIVQLVGLMHPVDRDRLGIHNPRPRIGKMLKRGIA